MICDCGKTVKSHKYFDRDMNTFKTEHFDNDPCPRRDAYQFLRRQAKSNEAWPATRLSIAFATNSREPAVLTAALDGITCLPVTPDDNKAFLGILALLHPYLLGEMNAENREKSSLEAPMTMSPQEMMRFVFYEDNRDLTKYIFALATGYDKVDMEKMRQNPSYQSKLLASFVATEMLARINSHKPQRLQLLISDLLNIYKIPVKIERFLTRMRLSADAKTLQDVASDTICRQAIQGKKANRWEFIMWIIDNIGFRKKVGYDQWTIVENIVVTLDQLIEAGIYHQNPDRALSRKRRDLTSLIANEGLQCICDKIIVPKTSEIALLSQYSLKHIQYAMEVTVPSHEECQEMEAEHVFHTPMVLHKNLGVELEVQVDEQGRESIYDRNNMTPQPVHVDLSKGSVVAELSASCSKAAANLVSAPNSTRVPDFVRESQPIQNEMTAIVGDGAPVYLSCKMAAEQGDNTSLAKWFFGGLHYQIESLNVFGRLFQETRGHVVRRYRDTPGRWKWVMFPRSPDDPMNEILPYIVALNRAAADCCADAMQRDVSPTEVLQHQLACAKANPNSLFALMELRYATLLLMLRDSEKAGRKGDLALFIASVRLSLPFCAVTNAYRYVEIGCDFLVWWETASDADRKLFENFIYTRQSENGLPIWSDRCIEWTMGHIRQYMGKLQRRGHDSRMHKTVAELPWREGDQDPATWMAVFSRDDISDSDTMGKMPRNWNESKLEGFGVTTIYALTYNYARQQRFWELPAPTEILSQLLTPTGETLNTGLLKAFPLGIQRLKHFFCTKYCKDEALGLASDSDDSDDESMKLGCIPCTALKEATDRRNTEIAMTSTSISDLQKLPQKYLVKADIIKEAEELQQYFTTVTLPKTNDTKERWLQSLCQLREDFFSDFPEFAGEIKMQLDNQSSASVISNQRTREKVLRSEFFIIDQVTMEAFADSIPRGTKDCYGTHTTTNP